MPEYQGSEWIKEQKFTENMSPLGVKVADLLGDLFLGIYHLPYTALQKVEWEDDICMFINIRQELATFDSDYLTRLVFLSHDRMLRVAIDALNFSYVRLQFNERYTRKGDICSMMPTIETALETYRRYYPREKKPVNPGNMHIDSSMPD